jgi:DNA repair protein RecN (Recombination protein N)
MLKELSIRNFAIIDDLQIRFEAGLTLFTGETGAGKSIIINAVNLLLGGRASTEMIRTGADSAELEALFEVAADSPVRRVAAEQGYDLGDGLLVRRVIARAEANRIYVNGRLATLQVLAAVTENLASISGQHAHQLLLKEEQHLLLLDQTAALMPAREAVAAMYREIVPRIKGLRELRARQARQAERVALLEFQQREIAEAALGPEEDRELEEERGRLKHAETLHGTVQGGIDLLYGAAGSVVEQVAEVRRGLEKMTRIDPRLAPRQAACEEIAIRVEDLAAELRAYLRSIEPDDRRLEAIEERLDLINRLKRKYGGSLAAVNEKREAAAAELAAIEHIGADISAAEERLRALTAEMSRQAGALSRQRRAAAKKFAVRVAAELSTLKMAGTRFEVVFSTIPADPGTDPHLTLDGGAVGENGIDRAIFSIAPNVGEALKPLAAVASGGELSRVVLALKSILAANETVATIVFDEVDAGIGGAVAEVVGRKLSDLARHHQVICITHLPQIAKFGDHHFRISKQVSSGRTRTLITGLSAAERTQEIARLLGGEKITRLTLEHARELLKK